MAIPIKVERRLKEEVPRFQKILKDAKNRDVNEADTIVIITDMLDRVFGMDKYTDITREYAIRGTYADLAIKIDGKVEYLIEAKAIGLELKSPHLRQAINYAAKDGIRWVVLTNGINWEVHRVIVDGKVTNDQVVGFNFLELSHRKKSDLETLYLLCKRGINKDLIEDFFEKQQACNKFIIGNLLCTEEVAMAVRRMLRRMFDGIKVDKEEVEEIIKNTVVKREILESKNGEDAQKKVRLFLQREARAKKKVQKKKTSEKPIDM